MLKDTIIMAGFPPQYLEHELKEKLPEKLSKGITKVEQLFLIYELLFLPQFWFMVWFGLMVLNTTFNNISVISWQPVLLVEETRVPGENQRPVAILDLCIILYFWLEAPFFASQFSHF